MPSSGLYQIINKTTHILNNSSCFDLIFRAKPKLVKEPGV